MLTKSIFSTLRLKQPKSNKQEGARVYNADDKASVGRYEAGGQG